MEFVLWLPLRKYTMTVEKGNENDTSFYVLISRLFADPYLNAIVSCGGKRYMDL